MALACGELTRRSTGGQPTHRKSLCLGFTHIALRLFYPAMAQREVLEHIDLVGKEVLPAVHRL